MAALPVLTDQHLAVFSFDQKHFLSAFGVGQVIVTELAPAGLDLADQLPGITADIAHKDRPFQSAFGNF